jgi:probable HAF family extracellular repeat protein
MKNHSVNKTMQLVLIGPCGEFSHLRQLATNQRRGCMKKDFFKGIAAAACAAVILAVSGLAQAADFTFSDLYLTAAASAPNYKWNPGQGKPGNEVYSINDKGQVVGYLKALYPSQSQTHLVRWDNVGSSSMTATDLGVPLSTGVMTAVGNGINYSGQIVGYTWGKSNFYHGLLYTPTSPMTGTSLDLNNYMNSTNGFQQTNALAINDSGKVVGIAGQNGIGNYATTTAFYFDGSTMIAIPGATLGSTTGSSSATAISNTGLVTGYSTANSIKQAYIWDSSTNASILPINNTLDAVSSWGNDINDSGSAVGAFTLSGGVQHAFLYQNSTMTDLGALGGTGTSEAMAINNNGVVVGTSNGHAFVYENEVMTDLNSLIDPSLGFTLTSATGINNLGQIVGYGTVQALYSDGIYYTQERAFALSPVPTPIPAALPLFVSGLGALGLFRKRFFRG